jgi:hypothetical protein
MTPTRPLPLAVSPVSPDIAEKLLSNELTPIADALEAGLGEVDAAAEAGADEVGDDAGGDADGVDNGAPVAHAATTKAPMKAAVSAFTRG